MTLTDFTQYLEDEHGSVEFDMLHELVEEVSAMIDLGEPICPAIIKSCKGMIDTLSQIQDWATFSRDK